MLLKLDSGLLNLTSSGFENSKALSSDSLMNNGLDSFSNLMSEVVSPKNELDNDAISVKSDSALSQNYNLPDGEANLLLWNSSPYPIQIDHTDSQNNTQHTDITNGKFLGKTNFEILNKSNSSQALGFSRTTDIHQDSITPINTNSIILNCDNESSNTSDVIDVGSIVIKDAKGLKNNNKPMKVNLNNSELNSPKLSIDDDTTLMLEPNALDIVSSYPINNDKLNTESIDDFEKLSYVEQPYNTPLNETFNQQITNFQSNDSTPNTLKYNDSDATEPLAKIGSAFDNATNKSYSNIANFAGINSFKPTVNTVNIFNADQAFSNNKLAAISTNTSELNFPNSTITKEQFNDYGISLALSEYDHETVNTTLGTSKQSFGIVNNLESAHSIKSPMTLTNTTEASQDYELPLEKLLTENSTISKISIVESEINQHSEIIKQTNNQLPLPTQLMAVDHLNYRSSELMQNTNFEKAKLQSDVADQIKVQFSKVRTLSGNQTTRFKLSPQSLGEVEIKFDTNIKTGHTNVSLLSERFTTLDILTKLTSQIEASLHSSGFKTESFTLNIGMQNSNNDSQNQAFHDSKNNNPSFSVEPSSQSNSSQSDIYGSYTFNQSDSINIMV